MQISMSSDTADAKHIVDVLCTDFDFFTHVILYHFLKYINNVRISEVISYGCSKRSCF